MRKLVTNIAKRLGENSAAFEFKMRIIIAAFIKIPCAECKERPCFTRYNFAPKAGLRLEAGGCFVPSVGSVQMPRTDH